MHSQSNFQSNVFTIKCVTTTLQHIYDEAFQEKKVNAFFYLLLLGIPENSFSSI